MTGLVDRPGIWYATFVPDLKINGSASVSQVRIYENGTAVSADDKLSSTDRMQRYRLPLFAFDKTKKYSLRAIVQGKESVSGVVKIERSRYMEPAVGVSVNARLNPEYGRYLTDYDFETVARTTDRGTCRTIGYLCFCYKPLTCSQITFNTGTLTAFYLLKSGHVEYSVDGETWIRGDKFEKGVARVASVTTSQRP